MFLIVYLIVAINGALYLEPQSRGYDESEFYTGIEIDCVAYSKLWELTVFTDSFPDNYSFSIKGSRCAKIVNGHLDKY